VKHEQFELLSGEPKPYTEKHQNGMTIHTFFCNNCSSPIARTAEGEGAEQFKGLTAIFIGTLDDLEELDKLKPEKEFWTKGRTVWRGEIEGAEQVMAL
jgi:hypothetical protein